MDTVSQFFPRKGPRVGEIYVPVTVANVLDPTKAISFAGLVDTGAFGLILPAAWRRRLGRLRRSRTVRVETADQRIVSAEVHGPVRIELAGFAPVFGEALFLPMRPTRRGYEALVGFTVLEVAGAILDLTAHRLVARKYFPVKGGLRAA
jgi:predicted aspartyl protease